MTRVLLVRHASHDRIGRVLCGRLPGVLLGERGKAEAAAIATRLSQESLDGKPIAAVYTSPLERAQETAEPVALACGVPPTVEADLDEIDFGAWTGLTFEDLARDPRWSCWNTDRGRARPPGGETMQETQTRMARWLSRMAERHPEGIVVGVSHCDVIRAGLAHVLGLPLHFYDRFDIAPASISIVVAGAWGMKVESINEAAP